MEKLTTTDRQTLCTNVDFLAVLAGDGVEVQKNGNHWICTLRNERTPSCHIYPPGVGRRGGDGWTLHDYGTEAHMDALGYLVDVRGLPFMDAVKELAQRSGFTPACLQGMDTGTAPRRTPPPAMPAPAGPPSMTLEDQTRAAGVLMRIASRLPNARTAAAEYLKGRGCDGLKHLRLVITAQECRDLVPMLAGDPDADLMLRAGILKAATDEKPLRLAWWDRVLLLACADPKGHRPTYYVGRRLDWVPWDKWGKYINQPTNAGAVRQPFNLPALYNAEGRDVLLVEGPMDALGAGALGWAAVALLGKPQAHHYTDRDGAAAKMLEAHLPALRNAKTVRVVPDNDGGEKGAEGEAKAAKLVGWLRAAGCRSELNTLAELCPTAPPECKDLADVAKLQFTNL